MIGLALFETAVGTCGIAWSVRGICGVQLPEAGAAATRARFQQRFPKAAEQEPPDEIRRAIDSMVMLLQGAAVEFADTRLDLTGVSDFNRRVYALARTIAPGETLSYGEIATRLGEPGDARAVGQALGRNPIPIIIPCHRVLAAGHRAGGFSARGGVHTKLRILAIEGALAANTLPLFREAGHER